jgi:hypothetical protein
MTHVRRKIVSLVVDSPIEIEPGVFMPPGSYDAECKELGVSMMGGQIKWTPPEYMVEITADQFRAMGAKNVGASLISIETPLTQFVRSGQIKVR